jgi:hypothetical protein
LEKQSLNRRNVKSDNGAKGKRELVVGDVSTLVGLLPTHQPFNQPTTNGKLVEFVPYSQKNEFSDATTNTRHKILGFMAKNNVDLADPEAVKLFLAIRKE